MHWRSVAGWSGRSHSKARCLKIGTWPDACLASPSIRDEVDGLNLAAQICTVIHTQPQGAGNQPEQPLGDPLLKHVDRHFSQGLATA